MADRLDNLPSLKQLQRLILQEEQDRVERLSVRFGDDAAVKQTLAPLIADVLREAGVKDHRRLASAIAPLVVAGIRTEIQNSRDMMVDALYPIVGRLVAAAIRNALKDLTEQLNEKLDASLSADRWRASMKARLTGRSTAEILLAEGAAFDIEDLLLIDRQSGLLIAQTGISADQGGMDSQLLGSLLSAIMRFVSDAMEGASEQDLRRLEVGDRCLHLQASPAVILAVRTQGPPPRGFETALNALFCDFLSLRGQEILAIDENPEDLPGLVEDLEGHFQKLLEAKHDRFRRKSKKGTVLLGTIAAILLAWLGWSGYQAYTSARIENLANTTIEAMPALRGYPIEASHLGGEGGVLIEGLVPDDASVSAVGDHLRSALPDQALDIRLGTLPAVVQDQELAGSIGEIRTELTDFQDALDRQRLLEAKIEGVDGRAASLKAIAERLDDTLLALAADVATIKAQLPSSAEQALIRLRAWLQGRAIRFGEGATLADEPAAGATLRALADRFRRIPDTMGLRVVGYADDSGGPAINEPMSLRRADEISSRLWALGVPADRLTSVGRSNEQRISQGRGGGSFNRRVEFELFVIDEQP